MSESTHRNAVEHGQVVSRRRLLAAGAAGLSAATVSTSVELAASRAVAALPTVRPFSSQAAYSALGVCALPQLGGTAYAYRSEWMSALAQTGASYFRGKYTHGTTSTTDTVRAARAHGIKWGMTVCPDLSLPDAELVARVRHIATNAADVCLFVEGINEPNHERGTGRIPADWARRTVAKQRLIWQTVKSNDRLSHVKVLGPKLQATVGTESQYQALGAAGVSQYMDMAALACYPGGLYPYHALDQRLGWIRRYWGGKPAWITETGYTNALSSTRGHAVVPEDVAAIYAPSLLLEAVERGCRAAIFELLDFPNRANNDTEHNFGLYATPGGTAPPWRAKPVVASLRSFLSRLKDPGPTYTPSPVGLGVTSAAPDMQSTVTAKRNGAVTVHLRRGKSCWDPSRKQRVSVPEVAVRLTTARGAQTVMVGSHVRSVTL